MPDKPAIVKDLVDRYGGLDRWRATPSVTASASATGLLFRMKWQPNAFRSATVRVSTRFDEPRVDCIDYPKPGQTTTLANDRLTITDGDGRELSVRDRPRSVMAHGRRRFRWDKLDVAYFNAEALWTYLTVPFVLTEVTIGVTEADTHEEDGETWTVLDVSFPDRFHTHDTTQRFYVDDDRRIRRHDYTAQPIAKWAKGAHYHYDHEELNGFLIAKRRVVFPRRADNSPRRSVKLLKIAFHDVTPDPA